MQVSLTGFNNSYLEPVQTGGGLEYSRNLDKKSTSLRWFVVVCRNGSHLVCLLTSMV